MAINVITIILNANGSNFDLVTQLLVDNQLSWTKEYELFMVLKLLMTYEI